MELFWIGLTAGLMIGAITVAVLYFNDWLF